MATFEDTGTGTTGGQYYTLKLEVYEETFSIPENNSKVPWALYLTSRNNYSFSNWSFPVTVNVDGEVYNSSEYRSMSANSTITLASGTKTISHNSDGTKTISCSATLNATGAYYLPGNMSVSGTLQLTTIPRYSNFTEHYVSSTGLNSITVKWNADAGCDYVQYSLNDEDWVDTAGLSYAITGLSPNTQYSIRTRIRRTDSQLWTESETIYGTTKDIARVTYAIDFNSDGNAYMEFTNPSGATVNLVLEIGSNYIRRDGITGSGGYTFKLTQEERDLLYSSCPNSNYLTLRYVVATLVNGVETYWNWADKKMTVVNSNPTFGNCEYRDVGGISTQLTGDNQTVINGYNILEVVISTANKAVAKNSATMSKYRLVCKNQSTEVAYSDDTEVILSLGYITDMTFTVYAIDSRGNSTPIVKSVTTWKDYFKPVIAVGTAERTELVNKETKLTFSGKIWNNSFGAEQNEIVTCKYEYKKTTDSEYTAGETELTPEISENTFSVSTLIKGDAEAEGFEISQSYDIKVTIADKTGNTSRYYALLSAGKPAMAVHRNGVSFGKPYDASVGGPIQIAGGSLITDWKDYNGSCNNITETCVVYVSGGTDCPAELNGVNYGYLFTKCCHENYIVQTFEDVNSNRSWRRVKIDGKWTSWTTLISIRDTVWLDTALTYNNNYSPANSDIINAKTVLVYYTFLYSGNKYLNSVEIPANYADWFMLEHNGSIGYVHVSNSYAYIAVSQYSDTEFAVLGYTVKM